MPWTVFKRKKKEDAFDPGLWIVDAKGNTIVDTGALDVWPLSEKHKAMIESLPELVEACQWAYDEMARSCPVHDNDGPIESPCMEAIARLLNNAEGRK